MPPLKAACKGMLSGMQTLENYACCEHCLLHGTMLLAVNASGCMSHAPNLFFMKPSKLLQA
jgi:hypothetical protein